MKKRVTLFSLLLSCLLAHAQIKNQADWQQQVSYQIDVTLDDKQHILAGELSFLYHNNSPDTLEEIYIHLWPNAYSSNKTAFAKQQIENGKLDFHRSKATDRGYIKKLDFKSSGNSLLWQQDPKHPDIAVVRLSKSLLPGEELTISTPFEVKIPKVFSRLGHQGQDYFITQWYPKPAVYDINGWNPMPYLDQGEFYSEFGDFTVNISLPQNYVVAATGTLITETEHVFLQEKIDHPIHISRDSVPASAALNKTITFKTDKVHDFAWFASKKFNVATSSVEIEGREVKTYVYAYEAYDRYLDAIKTALKYYSQHVGPYPYEHASVVKGELKAGGGMEYPMITLCDMMTDEVIIHEVGHNWFYGILGSNERAYPWMDESINSFYDNNAEPGHTNIPKQAEQVIFDILYKDALLLREYQAIGSNAAEFTYTNYGTVVYGIGAQTFEYLKAFLGEEKFTQAMKAYYETWKFRHPLPGDMKNVFEKETGENLSWFFDDIIGSDKILDYGIVRRRDEVLLVNQGEISAPVPLMSPGKAITWHNLAPEEELLLKDEEVQIDPEGISTDMFADNDALNNRLVLKPFTGKDKKGMEELYYLPAIGWNAYDKTMLGLMLHNYSFSNKPIQFHLAPMYALNTKTLTGLWEISYKSGGKKPGAYTEVKFQAKRFTWSQDRFRNYHYTKIQPRLSIVFPRSSHRSTLFKSLNLSYNRIEFTPAFDLEQDRELSLNPEYLGMAPWNFMVAEFRLENKKILNAYSFSVELEHGITNTKSYFGHRDTLVDNTDTTFSFPLSGTGINQSRHTKLSIIFNYKPNIGIGKKPLEIRGYISYFLKSAEDGYFDHNISNTGLTRDYRFDEFAFHRNANTGMFRNQISNQKEFSRFTGIMGQSDKLLANLIITVPLPGKIPLKPYVELLTYTDIDKDAFNHSGSAFIYNAGVEANLIPGILSVYFNLLQSKDVTDWQKNSFQAINKFHERITFRLDLGELTPPDVKKRVKLF